MTEPAATALSRHALSAEDLACIRGERVVFEGVGFRLEPGGALRLLGPNGAGKTSLIRILAGLMKPVRGRLAWDDADIAEEPERHFSRTRTIGHLNALKGAMTVAETLAFWARGYGVPQTAVPHCTDRALAALKLDNLADMPTRMLSAGLARRVNLARLAVSDAPLWLLDEPTTSVDRDTVPLFEALIAAHRARGGMAAVSSHTALDLPDAETLDLANHGSTAVRLMGRLDA